MYNLKYVQGITVDKTIHTSHNFHVILKGAIIKHFPCLWEFYENYIIKHFPYWTVDVTTCFLTNHHSAIQSW